MPRHPRFLPPGYYFHIMNRGNNGAKIFTCDDDFRFYLDKFSDLKLEHPFDLYHYCLMGTHLHLLVKIEKESDFSNFSKRLNLSYASYFQRNYGLTGHFWQGRYKSQLISDDPYFIQCGKYIELNPVKAGMIEKPEEYSWSSYRYYALGDKNHLLTEDIFYKKLGNDAKSRQKAFRELVVDDEIEDFMEKDDKIAVGNKKFIYNQNRKAKVHESNKDMPYRKSRS